MYYLRLASKIHLLCLMALYEHPDGFTLKELSEFLVFDKRTQQERYHNSLKRGMWKRTRREALP